MSDEDYYDDDFESEGNPIPTNSSSSSATAHVTTADKNQSINSSFNNNNNSMTNASFPQSFISSSQQPSNHDNQVSKPSESNEKQNNSSNSNNNNINNKSSSHSPQPTSSNPSTSVPASIPSITPAAASVAAVPLDLINPRSTAEYQIAWELELWRREHQEKFLIELKHKEELKLKQLITEFKRQELLREQSYNIKLKTVAGLEKKLSIALFDCQNHEKQLKLKENEIQSKLSHVNTEIGRKYEEAELAIKRSRDQLIHQQQLNKRIQLDSEQMILSLKQSNQQLELKLKESENNYNTYRTKISRSTIGELRIQLADKELSIHNWELKYNELSNEKSQLNQRIQLCLNEITRLNHCVEDKEKEKLSNERKEIQRLRMIYIAKQSSQGLRRDKEELESIKKELDKFKLKPNEIMNENYGNNSTGIQMPKFSLFNLNDNSDNFYDHNNYNEEKQSSIESDK